MKIEDTMTKTEQVISLPERAYQVFKKKGRYELD